jgi:hypothetical protein
MSMKKGTTRRKRVSVITAAARARPQIVHVNKLTLLKEASSLENLDQAFRWAMSREPKLAPHDVVVQDEYTNDVIFGQDDTFVVFDAT